MSYLKDNEQFFVLRTSISHWYKSAGHGGSSVPTVFTKRGALTALKNEARYGHSKSDGPYEMVPVTLVFGEPLKDLK